jgi:hypothetical protein
MKKEKLEKIDILCDKAIKNQLIPPKRSLFGSKCPDCNSNLTKETTKEMINTLEERVAELIKKLPCASDITPGIHKLEIEHFTCKCGYEFVKTDISPLREDV